jgi:uncharacterized protein YjcR
MSTNDDINALLGLEPSEIVKSVKTVKQELAVLTPDNLEEKIISETNNVMDSARNALEAVLDEVQSTPNDAELIEAASSLIKAQTGLVDALTKLHLNKEKHKQQIELAHLRISAEQQMNTENNQTKMLVSREEIMSRLMNAAKETTIIDT